MVAQPDPADIQVLRSFLTREVPEIPSRFLGDAVPVEEPQHAPRPDVGPEQALIEVQAGFIHALTAPREVARIGPGASRKIRTLLQASPSVSRCALLGGNAARVQATARRLAIDCPKVSVRAVVGDYAHDLGRLGPGGHRLLVVLGRAFGALHPAEVPTFLDRCAALMERSDAMLLGVELERDTASAGEKELAGYHTSMLGQVNSRFGADFDAEAFEHVARVEPGSPWVDHRLRARRPVRVSIPAADLVLDLAAGQEIRTGGRSRYSRRRLRRFVEGSALQIFGWLADPEETTAFVLLRRR